MKRLFVSIATALFIASASLLFGIHVVAPRLPSVVGRPDVREQREFRWEGVRRLELSNVDGRVRVVAVKRPSGEASATARVFVYTRDGSGSARAQEHLQTLFQASEGQGTVRLTTEPVERPDELDVSVAYEVVVNAETDLIIESDNGNVQVKGTCGAIEIRGHNADVIVEDACGPVRAHTTNGRIRVLRARSGALLETVNGNVYAYMAGGDLKATTTNGIILARVLNDTVSSCHLTSQNGGITLVMSEPCSARVDAVTAHGAVRSDFPVVAEAGASKRRQLRGVIGDGRTQLTAETLNGNIWIARSEP